jgi:chromosome segregation ATPase
MRSNIAMERDGRGGAGPSWVEDLSGPEDYWLTLTDAARVTRRQEVTIRRWVAAGSLPIRSRPLGLNKRTRHVRASDLSQLTPIVDPSATISGASAQIDLLGIPSQQAQILHQHREIDQRVHTLIGQFEKITSSQQEQLALHQAHLEQIERAAQELEAELAVRSEEAQKHQTTLGRQLTALQQKVRQLAKDAKVLQEQLQAVQAGQDRSAERQLEQDEVHRAHLTRVERLEERVGQFEKQLIKDSKDRTKQQLKIDAVVEEAGSLDKRLRQVDERLSGEIGEQQRAQLELEQKLKQLGTSVTQLRQETQKQAAASKRQASEIGKQMQALQHAIEEGRTRSQRMSDQLAQQQVQLEQLSRQVMALAAQNPALAQAGGPASKPVRQRRAKPPKQTSRET